MTPRHSVTTVTKAVRYSVLFFSKSILDSDTLSLNAADRESKCEINERKENDSTKAIKALANVVLTLNVDESVLRWEKQTVGDVNRYHATETQNSLRVQHQHQTMVLHIKTHQAERVLGEG